ncbi:MAG: hypothetical protein AB2989_03545 [Candidatus Symbiodolus clandestinus]
MKLNITIDNYFTTPSIHEKNRACLAKKSERKIVNLHLTKYQKEQLFHAMGINVYQHRSKIQMLKAFFQEKFKWRKRKLKVLKGSLKINQPKVPEKIVQASQFKIDNPIKPLKTVAVPIKDQQIYNRKSLESGANTSVRQHSQKLPDAAQPIGLSNDLIHSDADDQLSSVSLYPHLMPANSTDSTRKSIDYPPRMSETTEQALLQPMKNSHLGSPETYSHYIPNEVSLPENLQTMPMLQENPTTKFSAKTAKGLAISTAAVVAPLAITGAAGYALSLVAAAHPILAAVAVAGIVYLGVRWAVQRM